MAKLTTEKCKNDWLAKREIVKTTKTEYPGYKQITTITTYSNNGKLPTQSDIINNMTNLQLSNSKPSIGKSSLWSSIKNETNNYKNFNFTITTTKHENLNYESPYKSKNTFTDKSLNLNKSKYESPYQHRSPYLSSFNVKPLSPEILNSKKIIYTSTSPTTSNSKQPTLFTNNYNGIGNYSNKIISNKNPVVINKQNPKEFSYPNITKTYPVKLTSQSSPYKTNNNITPLISIKPLISENFHTQNINDNKRKLGPGKLYIFNHDHFQNPNNEYREGSKCDVKLLKDTFKKFKVNVTLFDNYTVKKVTNQVDKIFKEDFTRTSCIIIAILSHGNRMERIAANDGSYSIHDDILFPILRNKTLAGKPKILIVQACKGDMDLRELKTDSCQINTNILIPDEIYKFYSTSEGFVSYRSDNGSIFIRAFCEELQKSGKEKPIRDVMESAIKNIKIKTGGQQIPSMCVNNTEPYIFGQYC